MAGCVFSGPSHLPKLREARNVLQTSSGIIWSLLVESQCHEELQSIELRWWHEQLIAVNAGVFGWSLLVREQNSCKKSCPCDVKREQPASRAWMLSSLRLQIWEFLKENNSLCWCFHFYCIQEKGSWVKFFLPFFRGVSKQDYFKIMPRVQLSCWFLTLIETTLEGFETLANHSAKIAPLF